MTDTCATCDFHVNGYCRIGEPVVRDDGVKWPAVEPDEWCAEFNLWVPAAGSCATCTFYIDGYCRIGEPVVRDDGLKWPACAPDDWCGHWKMWPVSPTASVAASPITNSLGADVALNNTALYFDGPSIAQGTTGTWFVSGTVTILTLGRVDVKLWDGTTVIASTQCGYVNKNTISLSGYIANPAANLRISVNDSITTGGHIKFDASGNSKDSTITAFRIA